MPLYPVEVSTEAIVSLSDLKAHLRVDHSDEDALIQALERAAVMHLDGRDGWLGRSLLNATYEWRADDFCSRDIRLPLPPLRAVDSVQYYNASGTLTTLSTAFYDVVGVDGTNPGCVSLKYGYTWPDVQTDKREAVIITFQAGYAPNASPADGSVPAPILHAIKLLVGHWYNNREEVGPGALAQMPVAAEALLAPLRVHYWA